MIFIPSLHSTPPLGGSRRNIAMPFGKEKLEWRGYPMVKKLKICLFVSTECTNVTVTDRHTDTAWRLRLRLMRASRRKNDFKNNGHSLSWILKIGLFIFGHLPVIDFQFVLLCAKFHRNLMFFCWDMATSRYSRWRISTILNLGVQLWVLWKAHIGFLIGCKYIHLYSS